MKRTIAILSTALFLALGISGAYAQELKIGYVDPTSIMNKMPETAAVQKKLENFADSRRRELAQREQDFTAQVQAYQQKAAVISEEAKTTEEARLGNLQQELLRLQGQFQTELAQKQGELLGPIFQQIQKAIKEVADAEGLTYVINTSTTSGDAILLYVADDAQAKFNITDKVMSKLGLI